MGVFFILSVSDTIFTLPFPPKQPADRRGPTVIHGPQIEKHCCHMDKLKYAIFKLASGMQENFSISCSNHLLGILFQLVSFT